MPHLHIFNPENDFALALGRRSYTPDKGAVAIRRAGCPLPLWWAKPGDFVLIENDPEIFARAAEMIESYKLDGEVVAVPPADATAMPWGWSHHTRRRLLDLGMDPAGLPSELYLDNLRLLSHRRTAITVSRLIGMESRMIAVEATTQAEAQRAIDHFSGDAVVKLPWSSSGRGVIYTNTYSASTLSGYLAGMIRRQGSVTIEPRHDRLRDFAMLFESTESGIGYRGLSTFITDERGFYAGNIVDTQEGITRIIGADPSGFIKPLREALSTVVEPIGYRGPIGVDMMVCRDTSPGGAEKIVPCIEVNFRHTMGFAALAAARRLHPSEPMIITHSGLTHFLQPPQ